MSLSAEASARAKECGLAEPRRDCSPEHVDEGRALGLLRPYVDRYREQARLDAAARQQKEDTDRAAARAAFEERKLTAELEQKAQI